jgi:hypothetical protein
MKNISLASVLLLIVIGSVILIKWILTWRTVKEYSSTLLYGIVFILAIFLETVLNLWH